MSTSLLRRFGAHSPGRPGRSSGLLAGALLAAMAVAPAAQAQTFYGLNRTGKTLFITNVTNATNGVAPTVVPITGLGTGQTLVGLDSRPATGQLIALAYDGSGQGQLYTVNKATGAATAIGVPLALALGTGTEGIGFDFNPTVDRVRVTANNAANLRLNPNNGALAGNDLALNIPAGGAPLVGSIAYTNSFIGAATTVLYDIDESRSTLFIQNPPGNGTLVTPVTITLGGSPLLVAGDQTDFDIFTDPATRVQTTLLTRTRAGSTNLYSLDLTTGAATRLNTAIGFGSSVDDISFDIDRTAPTASGQLLFAVSTNNHLVSFNSGQPGFLLTDVPLTGITAGQTLVGTDFRPNTGELFGLGYDPALGTGNARLYVINQSTAVATPVGPAALTLDLGTDLNGISADFNPTVDRLRVTGLTGHNFRLNPGTGTIAGTDTDLNFVDGTTGSPSIGAIAYTNSFAGSNATRLFDVDGARNRLFVQGLTTNPNLGQLTAVNANPLFAKPVSSSFDLDIFFDAPNQLNRAFAVSDAGTTAPDGFSTLYTVDLTTATATAAGTVGLGVPVRDVAAFLTGANATAALTGRLLFAAAAGNLVSFDSGNPGVIRSAVNITGLPATQVIAGLDFRPLNGVLYALGYDAANQLGQFYILNFTSGALTPLGSLNPMPLGNNAAAIGVDFNPVNDAFRVVSATNQANLAINSNTGAVTVQANLTNPNGAPALSGLAYSNNDNDATTGTVLFGYDQVRNQLMSTANGAAGVYGDVGAASGISVNALGVDFEIFATVTNTAATANQGFVMTGLSTGNGTDNLYTIDLTTGAAVLTGRVGSGSNLVGLAAFLTPVFPGVTWTGAVSTDWGTAGNWNTNTVPTATDNVTIPNVANKPVVSNAQQANNVVLLPGSGLTTAPGGTLTVSGNFQNNNGALLGSGSGTVAFGGAAAQTIGGTTSFFNNLTAGPAGLTATAPVQVQQVLQLNGNLTSNGNLTLLSNATGTAQVVNAAGVVNGNATVQRFIDPSSNAGAGYRHFSSPIQAGTVASLTTPSFTPVVNPAYNTQGSAATPFPTVFDYEQTRVTTGSNPAPQDFDLGFRSPGALSDALEVGRGYTVNIPAAQTVSFVGALNNGNVTRSGLGRGLALAQDPSNASGWHLLGNPYPSPLDMDLLGLTNVDAAVYVFRSTGQFAGTYRSYVAGSNLPDGSDQLATGQGFFVRVSTPGSSTGQVAFTNAARLTTAASPVFQRSNPGTSPLVRLHLLNAAGQADETTIYFEAGATSGFDSQYDAYKLQGGSSLLLATEVGATTILSINAQPALMANVTVPLRVQGTPGTYTLRAADVLRLPTGMMAYLRDALTGTVVDLAQQPDYTFRLAGPATGRFSLLLTSQRVLATAPAALSQQVAVYPNPAHGFVFVALPADLARQATEVQVLNALGQQVLRATLPAGSGAQALALPGVAQGVYTLRLHTAQGTVSKRLVIE